MRALLHPRARIAAAAAIAAVFALGAAGRGAVARPAAHAAVIGGRPAVRGSFPWLAFLEWRGRSGDLVQRTCTGTVVSPTVVLTAAHCVVVERSTDKGYRVLL